MDDIDKMDSSAGDSTRAWPSVQDGTGLCKPGNADDHALSAFDDSNGMCKAGFANNDALHTAADGEGMCKAGFADGGAPRAVRQWHVQNLVAGDGTTCLDLTSPTFQLSRVLHPVSFHCRCQTQS